MKLALYHIVHVAALMLMSGVIHQAFAKPVPEAKRAVMMRSGILSLIVLITGFGMLAVMKLGFPLWIIIKLVCWLGLTLIPVFTYRMPEKIILWRIVSIVLVFVAIAMVYLKPFSAALE